MFRNMVTSLFKYDRIRTTDVKAKELRRWADQMVTLAKRGDLHARRTVLSIIRERDVVQKLFDEAQERYGAVSGGYTRIVKVGRRPGDAAPVSIIELISKEDTENKGTKKPKKKTAKPAAKESEPKKEEPMAATASEAPEAEAEPEETTESEAVPTASDAAPADVEAAEGEETSGNDAPEEPEKKEE
jgi:large subunit ribosomal protein L17